MSEEIKVTVVDYGKTNLMLRYVDPVTGRQKHKSAGTANRNDAAKAAGKWEDDLNKGRYTSTMKISWDAFRQRYEEEVLSGLAPKTEAKVSTVFNAIEKTISPTKLTDLTASRLSYYQAEMRRSGRSLATIKGHLSHLKAALAWAVRMGFLAKAPSVEMPKRAKAQKLMKGRPITGEEFDRMLAAVAKIVVPDLNKAPRRGRRSKPPTTEEQAAWAELVESWRHFLRGLWWSGLRLAESLELYWDREDKLCIDLSGKHPMLRIRAELEKGNEDRLLPIAPEFAEILLATPTRERTGRVFNPGNRPENDPLTDHRVGDVVIAIGKRAKVLVNSSQGKVKFASAHDLRRSFGERWAARVMPQILMVLMRHESIDTTMRYYAGRNAQSAAAVLWEAHKTATAAGNLSRNPRPNPAISQENDSTANPSVTNTS